MTLHRHLTGLSREADRLARRYVAAGWTVRRSANNHLILQAPDGVTTTAIPRKLTPANRSAQNAEAPLKRWLRQQEQSGCDSNTE